MSPVVVSLVCVLIVAVLAIGALLVVVRSLRVDLAVTRRAYNRRTAAVAVLRRRLRARITASDRQTDTGSDGRWLDAWAHCGHTGGRVVHRVPPVRRRSA